MTTMGLAPVGSIWKPSIRVTNKSQTIEKLHAHGLRVTKARLAVAAVLERNSDNRMLTPEEIFSKISKSKDADCDLVSVYRALAVYDEIGMLKKSKFQSEATRYAFAETSEHANEFHEHYFKCIQCDELQPLQGCIIEAIEKKLERSGYRGLQHHLEITGYCPSCAQSPEFESLF